MSYVKKSGIRFILLSVISLIFLNLNSIIPSQAIIYNSNQNINYSTATIISVGDIFIHKSVLDAVYEQERKFHNFLPCFQEVTSILNNADLATAWFGGVLDSIGPYFGYPAFKTPQSLAFALKEAGFDIMFRTNHTMDYGEKGLRTTTAILKKYNIVQIGAYLTEAQSQNIYVFTKGNLKISFLSYTYGMNDIPVSKPWMINFIDTNKIKSDIIRAKQISDFIIVALHFGTEYERYPNTFQRQTVNTLVNAGANLIIGSHPHVIQPVELTAKKVYVAYSLGNFFCGQRMHYCDAGVMLKYTIVKEQDSVYLKEISYIPTWNAKYLEKQSYKFRILPLSKNTIFNQANYPYLSSENIQHMQKVYQETYQHLNNPQINFVIAE
ncbi:MAG: CapA family protein [candidate division WOR-3 bacterium]